jgi:2-polyprenyl-6-methoxyphenol hydroxylase-like FAD-dependent oxidoreductase
MSRVTVIGGGPIGAFVSIAMSRRGHDVTCVDRDPGPQGDDWDRVGVMQFGLPHFFRPGVRNALLAEMPDVLDQVVRAGAVPLKMPGMPEEMTSLGCRRPVFERAIRFALLPEPGVRVVTGHADDVVVDNGVVTGVRVDGATIDADIVISAAGRAGKFGKALRGEPEGGPCGFAYANRMYRPRPGSDPLESPAPIGALADGYLTIVFPQDDATLSALIVRPADDPSLTCLRHVPAYEAAVAAIPNLAPWTSPDHFEPIGGVSAGAGLTNTYSSQGPAPGMPPAAGLYFIGDALSTTNPAAGRGITLGLRQAQQLLGLLDDRGLEALEVSQALDAWAEAEIKPWFLDHVYWDKTLLERFAGEDIDLEARIPSDVICAAAEVEPEIFAHAGPYMAMLAGPSVLDPVEEKARAVLQTGWRPPWAPGPSRAELADLVGAFV